MSSPSIDPANTWIISDTHWGHDNIVGFSHRPTDHDQVMMEEWARTVPEDGTVLHLGDLSWNNNARFKNLIAPQLTGERKLLILGNHDKSRFSFYRGSGFQIVKPFGIKYGSLSTTNVTFSHYPWDYRDGPLEDNHIHVHGHIHNNGYVFRRDNSLFTPFVRNQINMSVEQTKYRPVRLDLLLDGYLHGSEYVIDKHAEGKWLV